MSKGWKSRRRNGVLLGMVVSALLFAGLMTSGAQAAPNVVETLASSPGPLAAVAADPTTGLVYAEENNGDAFFSYNPRTNAWTELATAPIESENNAGATYLEGKIYVSYSEFAAEIAVYDIALDSWTTLPSPIAAATGDITSSPGKLYMAAHEKFVEYDVATEVTTELAEPPGFANSCHSGFEPWGGLQVDGGKIFGHEGNGCTGFAVYDIATDSWSELAATPMITEVNEEGEVEEDAGAVLGSALNPRTNTYVTYGPYGAPNLYRYDIASGHWATDELPFEVEDGGLAYVGVPGIEGVYIVQGENGTGFVRANETDLSASISSSVAPTTTGGQVTYSVLAKDNGPERANGVRLSDQLPAGSTLISATPSQGSCAVGPTVTCRLGNLASGAGATVTIKVAAPAGAVTDAATVAGTVIDTHPGNEKATSTVTVVPAAAPIAAPVQCKVPKLQGLKLKGAKKALRKASCAPGKVTRRFSRKVKAGRVIAAGKKAGKEFAAGTKIAISVSKGARPAPKGKAKGAK